MASRKQFHKINYEFEGKIGRNSVIGGTIVGDYSDGISRTLVIEMPKPAAKPKSKKRTPVAQQVADVVKRQEEAREVINVQG
jgi:hypothetical protein